MLTEEFSYEQHQLVQRQLLRRILVLLDGSSCAEEALPVAASMARVSGATITLLRVVPPEYRAERYTLNAAALPEDFREKDLHEAQMYLQHLHARDYFVGINVQSQLLTGLSVHILVDYAKKQQIDLIVMCSHGNTGLKRWIHGSVAQQLMRECPIPLLIIRQGASRISVSSPRPFNVLLALDGSILAESAILPAAWLSAAFSAPYHGKLHLLRVVQPNYLVDERAADVVRQMNEDAIEHARQYLEGIERLIRKGELEHLQLDVSAAVALEDDVAHTLLRVAEAGEVVGDQFFSEGYDMIAIATHGRSGLPRWIAGSVAEQLLGATKLPLLVVAHPRSRPLQAYAQYQSYDRVSNQPS